MKYQVWSCRLYAPADLDVRGLDFPLRAAALRSFHEETSAHALGLFSGWGSLPMEIEIAVIEDRLPDHE